MERPIPLLALSVAAGILGVSPAWLAAATLVLLLRDRSARATPTPSLRGMTVALLAAAGGLVGTSLVDLETDRIERCAAAAEWMDGRERTFEGVVTEAPLPTRRGWRVSLLLEVPLRTMVHLHSADPCPPYRIGDRVRGRARFEPWSGPSNPGEFDLRRHRLVRGISGRGRLKVPPPIVGFAQIDPFDPGRTLGDLRRRIRRGIKQTVTDSTARGLALALTLGERGALPDSVRDDFVRAGMAHLLAISGLHLALGALLLSGTLKLLLLPFASRLPARALVIVPLLGSVPLVLTQTALAGAPPSCLRAATMILHLAAARLLGRRPDAATALGLAALVNLLHHPGAIHEAGFQLSFGATAAILWSLSRRSGDSPRRALAGPASDLARISVAAFLGTAPFVAWHFGPLPLAGPLVNLAAVPLASMALLPGALLLGACSAASGTAPLALGWFFEVATRLETGLATVAADLSPSASMVPVDAPWLALTCLGLLWTLRVGLRRVRPWLLILVGSLGLCLTMIPASPGHMDVWLLDVGEGNLAVLRLPCGRVLLMDGGPPGSGRRTLLPFLRSQGIRRVDDLVISHGHADHYSGALEVYRDLGAPRIISNGSPLIHQVIGQLVEANTQSCVIDSPEEGIWDLCGVRFQFISPGTNEDDLNHNDRSLVIFLTGRNFRILFTGDMGPRGWAFAAPLLPSGRVSLLQIPHHGHPSPHLPPLLSTLNPLFSFCFSDGSQKNGGNMGTRRIVLRYSSVYHISGLHGSLHFRADFPTLRFSGGAETKGSP